MVLHPQILEREGKKEFVVLPYDEYLEVQEALEDFDDLKDLRIAKKESEHEASIPLSQVKQDLGL